MGRLGNRVCGVPITVAGLRREGAVLWGILYEGPWTVAPYKTYGQRVRLEFMPGFPVEPFAGARRPGGFLSLTNPRTHGSPRPNIQPPVPGKREQVSTA